MQQFMRAISICLSFCLAAQELPPPRPRLNIMVVEGEAMMHNIRERKAANIVVIVRDGNRRPVEGAAVTFKLPADGPSARFPNDQQTLSVTSDGDGYAIARGLRPNTIGGPYTVEVEARHGEETATASVTQFNSQVESRGGGSGKWIALVAIVGAAAAGGAVALSRKNGNSPAAVVTPTPIGITPGAGTVGPPR